MNLNSVLINGMQAPGHEEIPAGSSRIIYPRVPCGGLGGEDGKQAGCVLLDSGWNIPNILPKSSWDGSEHPEEELRSFSAPSHTNIPVLIMEIIPV